MSSTNTEFASAGLTAGQLNAIVKKLGGHDEAIKFLQGELSLCRCSTSFSVTSDGTTGEDWITRLESKGYCVSDYVKQVLLSPDFKPTNGVTTNVTVHNGKLFEWDGDMFTPRVLDKSKLLNPNAELYCLIGEKFTPLEIERMGLWHIVAMQAGRWNRANAFAVSQVQK